MASVATAWARSAERRKERRALASVASALAWPPPSAAAKLDVFHVLVDNGLHRTVRVYSKAIAAAGRPAAKQVSATGCFFGAYPALWLR